MRTNALAIAVFTIAALGIPPSRPAPRAEASAKPIRVAAMCFFQYEEVSGMNKICYYDCLGSLTAINIASYAVCPVSIER